MLSGLVTSKIVTSKNDEILTKITNHFSRSKFPSKVFLQTVLFWFWNENLECAWLRLGWLSLNCVKNTRRSLNDMNQQRICKYRSRSDSFNYDYSWIYHSSIASDQELPIICILDLITDDETTCLST